MKRLVKVRIDEISAVDRPAQAHARAVIIKREFSADQREHLAESGAAMPDGSFPIANRQDLLNAVQAFGRAKDKAAVARHIKARAAALGLNDLLPEEGALAGLLSKGQDPANQEAAHDGGNQEIRMTPEEKAANDQAAAKLETLQKRAERAEKVAELTDAQRALFQKMDAAAQDAFLAKGQEQRQAEVEKAREADPVVYTDVDGNEFRKSENPRVLAMAKRLDEERRARLASDAIAKRERLEKRAERELSNLPGTKDAKAALLEAADSVPEAMRQPVAEILKAANTGLARAFETRGISNEPVEGDPATPEAQIGQIAKRIREADPKVTPEQAYDRALQTPEGKKLYASHLARR